MNSPPSKRIVLLSYFGIIIATTLMYNNLHKNEPLGLFGGNSEMFFAVFRSIWSLTTSLFVLAFHLSKIGGIFRWFFSLEIWQPFSKLTLSIYLIHTMYLDSTSSYLWKKSAFGCWFTFTLYVNDIVISVVLGTFLYLFVEAPLGHLISMMRHKSVGNQKAVENEYKKLENVDSLN